MLSASMTDLSLSEKQASTDRTTSSKVNLSMAATIATTSSSTKPWCANFSSRTERMYAGTLPLRMSSEVSD